MCLLPNVFTKLSRQRYLNVHVEKDFFKAKYYSLHRLFFSWHPQFVGEDVVLLRLLPRTRNRVNENKHVLQKNLNNYSPQIVMIKWICPSLNFQLKLGLSKRTAQRPKLRATPEQSRRKLLQNQELLMSKF